MNLHLARARDWHPHDYVPWDEGRDLAALGGIDWEPEQSALSPVAKAAMITDPLTEDNLASYHGAGDAGTPAQRVLMAECGVYDLRQHPEEVLEPVPRQWNIFGRTDFSARGEQVRERLAAYLDDLRQVRIPVFEEQRDRALARTRQGVAPGRGRARAPADPRRPGERFTARSHVERAGFRYGRGIRCTRLIGS